MNSKLMSTIDTYQATRTRLFGLAYRLLGSRVEAEDVVQEAWLKWRAVDTAGLSDPEAWLVTVVTRLGIDRQRELKRHRETYKGPWLPEPLLDETEQDAEATMTLASDLSMAFLVTLEALSAEERAAFLLREVFDYSHEDIAGILNKTAAASRQLVSRARARLRDERPRYRVDADQQRQVVTRFIDAMMSEDSEAFARLMAEEVCWVADGGGKAQAASQPVHGIRAATRMAMGLARSWRGRWHVTLVPVNGQPGAILWVDGEVRSVTVLETEGGRVLRIYSVVNPDKLPFNRQLPPLPPG
ncbi:RNA polymerase sigma factor SigJ [Natronospirillum operosum]|nr:RNA polymerase sigma factor SigJ [Natronospirillum operosum]